MAFPKPQNPFDWITQLGHIVLGRKVDPKKDQWLLGPIGFIGEKADEFVSRIATEHNLEVKKNEAGVGLIDNIEELEVSINPKIKAFYQRTSDFQLDAWTEWKPFFRPFGLLVGMIFSKRIQQLYLPMNSLETAQGISSTIIRLTDSKDKTVYRIWHRKLKSTEENIFYGIYSHCRLPSGKPGIKTTFPLPQGNATAIFGVHQDTHGNLELISSGKNYGDAGFYVLIEDQRGVLYKHYMPYFRQRIHIYEDDEGITRANHVMNLWSYRIHNMHYKIVENQKWDG